MYKISYIGSTIKESNKQCWLAPIREGNHWTLCAICPESNIIYWFDSVGREQGNDIEKIFTEALEMYHIIGEKSTKCYAQIIAVNLEIKNVDITSWDICMTSLFVTKFTH